MGTAPRELTSERDTAHAPFEPRTALAGRRARSISAANLSTPSMAVEAITKRRVRGESSLHFVLAVTALDCRRPDGIAILGGHVLTAVGLRQCARAHRESHSSQDPGSSRNAGISATPCARAVRVPSRIAVAR